MSIYRAPFAEEAKFTQTPNDFFDLVMPLVSGNEFKILALIVRKTRGFQKRSDEISYAHIKEGTGIKNDTTVSNCLKRLHAKGLILRKNGAGQWKGNRYALNAKCLIPTTETVVEEFSSTENRVGQTTENGVVDPPKTVDNKINKETTNTLISEEAEDSEERDEPLFEVVAIHEPVTGIPVTATEGPEPEQQAEPSAHSQGEVGAEDSERLPAPRRISRDDIYRAYPRPAYQNEAVKAIAGAVRQVAKDHGLEEQAAAAWLLKRTKQYAASPAGEAVEDPQDDRRPHPAKWFSGGGYNDIHEWSKPNGNQSRRTSADRRADNLAELTAVRERLEADLARDSGASQHDSDGSVIEGIVVTESRGAGNGLSRYDFAGEHAHRLRPQHADWRFDAANGAAMVRALKRQRDADLYAAAALRHVH